MVLKYMVLAEFFLDEDVCPSVKEIYGPFVFKEEALEYSRKFSKATVCEIKPPFPDVVEEPVKVRISRKRRGKWAPK